MKTRLSLFAVLMAAFALVACTPVQAPAAGAPVSEATADATADATAEAMAEATAAHDMAGMEMDHSGDHDLSFIDGMIPHHEGAVAMAQQALEESERPEIRQLAEAIIEAQNAEIQQLREWRTTWFGDAPSTMDGHAGMHGSMHMTEVPAGDQPFDLRFIDGMIPHHEDAISMAQDVLAKSERPEIRQLAEAIIAAQAAEIAQMQEWRAAWFPNE